MIQVNCKVCRAPFLTHPSKLKTGRGIYCSLTCRSSIRKTLPVERICKHCSKQFTLPSWIARRADRIGEGQFCSHSCASRHQLSDPQERFWQQVKKVKGEKSCWLWAGDTSPDGYGKFSLFRDEKWHSLRSHRYVYEITYGTIPVDLLVLHECDNPICVRPDHLFLGTQQDNIADKVTKRRQARGEKMATAKLTASQVQMIRSGARMGLTLTEIAKVYRVSIETISAICRYRTWKHVR